MDVVFNLLRTQYPNVSFNDVDSWPAISNEDLLSITSLLLHHTCVTDPREVLTTPLCQNLSQATQLSIKLFLENVNYNTTNAELKEVIKLCVMKREEIILSSSLCLTNEDSVLNCVSPLEDLLSGTPKLKNVRFLERDREVKRLKRDLELERYEKADLQEEFKLQQEKNEKLSKRIYRYIYSSKLCMG